MGKTKLFLEYDYDFVLIGIISRVHDYKLSWSLNRSLELNLTKEDDIEIPSVEVAENDELTLGFDTQVDSPRFSFYTFDNEAEHVTYTLVANRSKSALLIKEEQSVDFFLIIDGIYDEVGVAEVMRKMRDDKTVMTAFQIDPNRLKSKQNLLFD